MRRSGLLERPGREQFGALVEHVRVMLDVPVSIISVVDDDRQVFAGHCGLPEPWASQGETPMSHSFCQHVADRNEILIVADAHLHELVKDNHAIGDLGVVAYLGVPIALPGGEVVGALAAIDIEPRQWTERDLKCLQSLAKVVEREMATTISEHRYRSFFEDMQEGYYVARLVRGDDGRPVDIIFEDLNPAFQEITGFRAADVIGSRLSDLAPTALDEMLPAYEQALQTGQLVEHANQVAQLGGRWFENRIRPLPDDRIASTVTEVTARKVAEIRLQKSEAHWRGLFEQLDEGFILGEVVRDDDGKVIDWRYNEVNRAWGKLVGVPSKVAAGRTVREVFPGIEEEWIHDFARVVDTQEPTVFVRPVALTGRWYEGRAQPLGSEKFIVIFMDVTERVLDQRRQTAVLGFMDRIRHYTDPDQISLAACESLADTLGVGRVAYGDVDAAMKTVSVSRDWTAPGVSSLVGQRAFESFGPLIEQLKQGHAVAVDDCDTDPRVRDIGRSPAERDMRAFVHMPVLERGIFVGLLSVGSDHSRHWTESELGFIRDVAMRVRTAVARLMIERDLREALERQRLALDVGEVGIWELDLQTDELTLDARMRRMNGVFGDQLNRAAAFAAVHPDDLLRLQATLSRVASGELATFSIQYRVIGIEDGIVRSVQVNGLGFGDSSGRVTRLMGAARDITDRVAADDRRMVLNQELAHRLKNNLALVQSLVTQTLRTATDITTAKETLSARIIALSKAHDILMSGRREAAEVRDVVRSAAAIHDAGDRVRLEGPALSLGSKAALTLSLIVHELATNASKYGSLSVPGGHVRVSWQIVPDEETASFAFEWLEIDGPPVVAPTRQSFGTRLIRMGLAGRAAEIDYRVEGVRFTVTAPLDRVQQEDETDSRH